MVKLLLILLAIVGFILLMLKSHSRQGSHDDFTDISQYASRLHRRQDYDGKPYSYHLSKVAEIAKKYWDYYGEDPKLHTALWMAAWLHDSVEDVPSYTYNDILKYSMDFFRGDKLYGEMVANIVYACTNEKGKNRKERANDKYYQGIRETGYAPFIKACDRLANMQYAFSIRSSMATAYRRELPEFLQKIEAEDNPIPPELKQELCRFLED